MLKNLYDFIATNEDKKIKISNLPELPDHNIVYGRAALEQKFNRKFSYVEVEQLYTEVFNYPEDKVYIPQWYKDKWFR